MSARGDIVIMPCLSYRVGGDSRSDLFIEQVSLDEIVRKFGEPVWVYSRRALFEQYERLCQAFGEIGERLLIATSVKANGNIHLLRELSALGGGADITSMGELILAREAGVAPEKIVFAGVGKTDEEIGAALQLGIKMFNVESEAEMDNIALQARNLGKKAPVSIRFNPNVDGLTHELTTTGLLSKKFGVENAFELALLATKSADLELVGLQVHIGSPIYRLDQVVYAFNKLFELYEQLEKVGISVPVIDLGGQLAIDYGNGHYGQDSTPEYLAERIIPRLQEKGVELVLEPGRFLFGNTGVLISKVLYVKTNSVKTFVIQSAGMNHLIRPAMYDSFHRIVPLSLSNQSLEEEQVEVDVVGPICESSDYLAHGRKLARVRPGDYLVTLSAGAYGSSMSSRYNGQLPAAEVLVDGNEYRLIRRRETIEDLMRTLKEV